jgi:hypothetical protein
MATEVRRRRGTSVEHSTFTGAIAELTVDLTKDTVVVHDGATQGGFPLLREDLSNVPTTAPFTHITLDTAIFDTAYTETGSETQGTLYWNQDEETLSLVTNGETIELGQKVEVNVKNQTGSQINKGEVVYASGTVGNSGRILVTKMIADGTIAAKQVLGVAAENIANGADGKVIKFGKLRKINTTAFSEGDILWVSTTVAGAFQNTEPVQANGEIALPIAFVVTDSANVGEIFIRVNPIDENEYQNYDAGLTDIAGLTPTDSNIIVGDGANWVAESGDTARTSLGLGTGDSPTFAGLTVDGLVVEDEVRDLQSDVIENHLEIESLQGNKVEVGFLFPDGDGQALGTGDNVAFNTVTLGEQADSANEAVRADRNVSAGDGVTGGGDLTADRTLTLGTPSTTTVGGTNAVTTGSHTHALDLSGRSITLSDDSDSVITFDTNTQDLGVDRTFTPTIADHASGQRGVLNTGSQDIYGAKTFINNVFADANVGTSDFVSQTTGWNVTNAGAADFRSLYSDEIRTEAFIAEISEALVGADFLTKSRGVLSRNFTIPSDGNTGTLFIEDLEGFEGTQVFSDNDWIRLRVIDKSGGGLVVADVYGQVTSYTDLSGGEQSWTFTTDDDGGSSGSVIYAGSVALDYGQSGDGFIVRTTLDSQGSPYSQVVRWTNTVSGSPDPNDADTTYTVLTRTGELSGIAGLSGAGLYAKDRVYFDFGDANIFQLGKDVGGVGSHGVFINANNYWYGTGDFKVGNGTQSLELTSGDLTGTFGDITFTSDEFTLTAGSMTIDETDGISLDANNYWNQDGTFKVSNGTQFLELSAGDLTGTFGNIDFESNSFTLTAGSMTIDSTDGVVVDANNFFKQDSTFSFGGGLLSGTGTTLAISGANASITVSTFDLTAGSMTIDSTDGITIGTNDFFKQDKTFSFGGGLLSGDGTSLSISGSGASIDVDTFTLDAGTIILTNSSSGKLVLGTDADNQLFNDGIGFFADGNSNFRIGSIAQGADDYISYDTTDGLKIELGGDDLSTAIADIRSDLIDIYLADQSTFAGIQFLSGQITLKVGADGKVASARLDATGDESAITLRADFFDFQSDDIVILGDPNQDAGTEAKIALGSNADTITVANTTAGFIASGAGEFKGYIDANNYLRLDSSGLDIKAEEFDLKAGDLLINSATSTQTAYTPANETSLISNGAFTSTVTFNDNDLDGTSGTFGTIDESVDWEADRLGTSTFLYDGTNDSVFFRIAKTADTNRVRLWQDQETLTSYFGKTLKFTATINRPSGDTWVAGDLYFKVYAEINSTLTEIATTIINYNDLTTGTPTDFDVTAFVRDDFTALRIAIEYPEQDATTGAPISYHEIEIQNVSTVIYDKTQVTLNNNGLSVFKSPIQEFTLTADDFALNGIGIKTDDISIPNLIELNRATSSMRVPDEGYANFAYTEIGGASRLYVRLSDGTLKYVNLT